MSTIVIEARQCPNCGRLMAAGPLAGLCPACLLGQGSSDSQAGAARVPFVPPPIDEVRRLFPHLEIVSLLGAGGMGAVYKARQSALDRWVALKILPAENSSGVNFAERFNREARALARLNHPNIVTVHEFGQAELLHYFIMEFVDGTNLRQLEQAGRLSAREALQLIPQICDALQYAHDEGVVHRDIKPENVLVDRKGRVKIADFGLAKILNADPAALRLTLEGQVMGTPHYMAPEQVERPLSVDHRADIYALGVVFYEMLTGDLPLGKFPPPSRKVEVDVRLDEVVLRALENDPARRYQNASEVKSRVETITATPPALKSEASGPIPGRLEFWKGALLAGCIVFGILTVLFGFVSAITGRSLMGWLGVVGGPSVFVRLLLSGLIVGWLIRTRSKDRRTLQGVAFLTTDRPAWLRKRGVITALLLLLATWTIFQKTPLRSLFATRSNPEIKIAQTARRDSGNGRLVVRLPGRGTVELLAIGNKNAALNGWWLPDGTIITNAEFEVRNPVENSVSKRVSRDLLWRVRDLPDGASSAGMQSDPPSGVGSGAEVFRDGKPLAGAIQARFAWEPSTRKANIQCGFALKPWRTIASFTSNGSSRHQRRKANDLNWTVTFHHLPMATAEGSQVALIFGPDNPMWIHRVIAIDTNGTAHPAQNASGSPVEKLTLWSYTFDRLPLAQVKEFQVQVRPVHWVEFRNVALNPEEPLPPERRFQFGPAAEISLHGLFDFDGGSMTPLPAELRDVEGYVRDAWMKERGFDVVAADGVLHPSGMDWVALREEEWETIEERDLAKQTHGNYYRPSSIKVEPFVTLGFRTREHGVGMLQFLEGPDGEPVRLRYKMLQRGPISARSKASLSPAEPE